MKHTILVLVITLAIVQTAFGQMRQPPPQDDNYDAPRGFDKNKLVFGGNFGLTFGDFTFVNLSPQVGYQFSKTVIAGGGINYISNSIKTRNLITGDEVWRENFGYAGANLFTRIFPTNFLFFTAQPEANYRWGKIKYRDGRPTEQLQNEWVPTFLVGAGVALGGQNIGRGTLISVMYDLAQDPRSPYGTRPFINFGFAF